MEVSRTVWVGSVAGICEMRNADNILATKHGGLRQRRKLDCSVEIKVGKEQSVTMWTEKVGEVPSNTTVLCLTELLPTVISQTLRDGTPQAQMWTEFT